MMRSLTTAALRAPRTALVLFCLAAWAPGVFVLPPGDRDESRFAQATKQMIETGDYVRIMNGAEPRNRKPIGIYWLQAPFALAARAAGMATENPIWPYRMPSVLGGLAAVLATFELGVLLTGERRGGLAAGAMLGGCVILAVETHIAKTDAALAGSVTIAMGILARAWLGASVGARQAALFWLALAAGILLKGPVAPMVIGLAAVTLMVAARRARWLLALRPAWGAALMLAAVLPWFVAIGIATRGAFFAQAVGGDLGSKLAGGAEAHGGFPGLHVLLLPLLAFPSSLAVFAAVPAAWARRREPAVMFLLAWLVPSWVVFEAVPTKLPHYTLPLYPAVFLLAAIWLVSGAEPLGRRWLFSGRVCVAAVAAVLGGAALALPIALHAAWWLGLPGAVASGLAGWVAWRGRPLAGLAAAIPLYGALLAFELPSIPALWLAPRVEEVLRRALPGTQPLGRGLAVAGYAEPSLMFAAGTFLRELPDGTAGAAALAEGSSAEVLVEGRDLAGFEAEAMRRGMQPKRMGGVGGFNYSRGRWTTLSLFSR